MNPYQTTLWSATLPAHWEVEQEEEFHIFHRPDGFGALEISTVEHDQDVSSDFLQELAAEHLEAGAPPAEVKFGPFKGFELSYEVDDEYWREWYLSTGRLILFATYNCAAEDEDLEDEAVSAILQSLRVP